MTTAPVRITTARLELVSATTGLLETELASPAQLGVALGAQVAEGWPPGEYDEHAIRWLLERLSGRPEAAGWFAWYALLKPESGPLPQLVAAGGYTGPPDDAGEVEIGYSVVRVFEGRGIATEMVGALVHRAFNDAIVSRIIAHTFPANTGSIRVLEKNGFTHEGAGKDAGTIRYGRYRDRTGS